MGAPAMKRSLPALMALGLLLGVMGQARSDFLYWSEGVDGDIHRANLDGTGQQILLRGLAFPDGIALDVAGGKIYWIDNYSLRADIRQANLDGTDQQTLVSGLVDPFGIALDVAGGKIYWTDIVRVGAGGYIGRVNLDGSQPEILLSDLFGPLSLARQLGPTPVAEPS